MRSSSVARRLDADVGHCRQQLCQHHRIVARLRHQHHAFDVSQHCRSPWRWVNRVQLTGMHSLIQGDGQYRRQTPEHRVNPVVQDLVLGGPFGGEVAKLAAWHRSGLVKPLRLEARGQFDKPSQALQRRHIGCKRSIQQVALQIG